MSTKKTKGVVHTIEVLIAVGLIFAAVAFLFRTGMTANLNIEKQNAYYALSALNADGSLREAVAGEDREAVKALLDMYFDNYDFEICSAQCFGTSQQATIVEYYVSGFGDTYDPKKLRIFLFRRL